MGPKLERLSPLVALVASTVFALVPSPNRWMDSGPRARTLATGATWASHGELPRETPKRGALHLRVSSAAGLSWAIQATRHGEDLARWLRALHPHAPRSLWERLRGRRWRALVGMCWEVNLGRFARRPICGITWDPKSAARVIRNFLPRMVRSGLSFGQTAVPATRKLCGEAVVEGPELATGVRQAASSSVVSVSAMTRSACAPAFVSEHCSVGGRRPSLGRQPACSAPSAPCGAWRPVAEAIALAPSPDHNGRRALGASCSARRSHRHDLSISLTMLLRARRWVKLGTTGATFFGGCRMWVCAASPP